MMFGEPRKQFILSGITEPDLSGIPLVDDSWSFQGPYVTVTRPYFDAMVTKGYIDTAGYWNRNHGPIFQPLIIRCTCVWVDRRRIVWVPDCPAHGGRCSHQGCNHQHYSSQGD